MAVTAAGETPRSSATRRFVAVLSLLALAVTRLALPGSAEAAFPGANGKIAFASNRDGDYEIYKMNSDGSGVTKLTNDPASDNSPAWSPGGDRIVFERDFCSTCFGGEIWVMNADGSGQTKLLSFVGAPGFEDPAWSPDAQQIAFTRDDHCGGSLTGLNVMNADGTDPHNIVCTGPGGRFNRFRSWSPDGQTIVFTAGLPDSALFAISPDGSGLTQLTTGPGESFGDLSPDWSPDGTKIAFRRAPYSGPVGIYTMNADGTGQVSITSAADDSPAWSPDGTRIASQSLSAARPARATFTP